MSDNERRENENLRSTEKDRRDRRNRKSTEKGKFSLSEIPLWAHIAVLAVIGLVIAFTAYKLIKWNAGTVETEGVVEGNFEVEVQDLVSPRFASAHLLALATRSRTFHLTKSLQSRILKHRM